MKRYYKKTYIRELPEIIFSVAAKLIIAVLSVYIIIQLTDFSLFSAAKINAEKAFKKISKTVVEIFYTNASQTFNFISDSDEIYMSSFSQAVKETIYSFVMMDIYAIYYSNMEYVAYDPGYEAICLNDETNSEETLESEEETDGEVNVETLVQTNTIVEIPKLCGTQYTLEQLTDFDFLVSSFYTVTAATELKSSDIDAEKFINMDLSITGSNDKPQILIYHTHSQEAFSNSIDGDTDTTIIAVGDYLAEILETQFGYNVIHDTSTYDLVDGKLDRSKAYSQARTGIKQILEENPTIEVILDIHRDGVSESTRLVTEVNGKETAQIMFFNGISRLKTSGDIDYLYNPYLSTNLAMSLQMKLAAEAYYPDLTRKNYINAYKYNLDLCDKAMLIEVGAQTNTYQEAVNAAEPLAVLLNMVLGGG